MQFSQITLQHHKFMHGFRMPTHILDGFAETSCRFAVWWGIPWTGRKLLSEAGLNGGCNINIKRLVSNRKPLALGFFLQVVDCKFAMYVRCLSYNKSRYSWTIKYYRRILWKTAFSHFLRSNLRDDLCSRLTNAFFLKFAISSRLRPGGPARDSMCFEIVRKTGRSVHKARFKSRWMEMQDIVVVTVINAKPVNASLGKFKHNLLSAKSCVCP